MIVSLNKVSKEYHLGEICVKALEDLDLNIGRGEFVAIWGPSGSGKSTLCNLIGLLDKPSSGTVLLNNQDVTNLSDNELSKLRNRSIGFIFQSFNLIPVLTALENVMLPLQIQGKVGVETREKAAQRLVELGLGEHLNHRPYKLSGGQQQRVAIARALITDPVLVIADEPTANLDSDNAWMIIDLMLQLNQQSGTTFIFATHDQRLLKCVKRQVLLQDGSVVEDKVL